LMRIQLFSAVLILLSFTAFAKSHDAAVPTNTQQKAGLHLRQACKDVCREARTPEEVSRCVSTQEALQGTSSFHQAHPLCALARKNYLAAMNNPNHQNEPERYG